MKQIAFSKQAAKTLRDAPKREAERIIAKIEQYASDPASLVNMVTAMVGSPYIRLKVSDWRVIMDDQGTVLEVVKIGKRREVYR